MSFSINTNVASLQAQNYLRVNSDFQGKTISRVTSGLRIVSSGDDAAGLAIANGYRSDEAVLTQGVRNANDGLSQLQIMDGGISNISMLLDRARTLATQSASGTFFGERSVLNGEFQSVLAEIDRQAQSIGLNQGGTFAKNLSVFIGGGKGVDNSAVITNGSVSVNLAASTVDTKSLGLAGVQAIGVAGTDIGTGSASTKVSDILANTTNTGSEAVSGSTVFYFQGPGFSGANRVGVSVNLSGVTDTTTLAAAINNALQNTGGSQYATALKNANITAAINTDINGKQQLTFSSSVSSFQVEAGDRVANAFLGNFSSGSTGVALQNTVTGAAVASADATTFGNTGTIVVRIQGGGLAAPQDIQLAITSGVTTVGQAVTSLTTQVAANAALQAAGITVATHASGTAVQLVSNRGEGFQVSVVGDKANLLGAGSFQSGATATNFDNIEFDSGVSAGYTTAGASTFEISIGGGAAVAGSVTLTAATQANALSQLNALFSTTAAFQAAGLVASANGDATHIKIVSSNNTNFRFNGLTDLAVLGISTTGVAGSGATASALTTKSTFNAGGSTRTAVGASGSDVFYFGAIRNGSESQAITLTAPDATGLEHTLAVTLNNTNARTLDEALTTINTSLRQSNDATLQQIVAVKEQGTINGSNVEGLRFLSTLGTFKVSLGKEDSNTTSTVVGIAESTSASSGAPNYVQGNVYSSSVSTGGGTADIGSQATAQAAVSALSVSVSSLGKAQAVVGRGQNQFNYAINLAQSQLTNLTTAESRIRDADLASEAANLTKAQILLQAGVAALAQANAAPQAVLSLLKG